jgi:hypothetical protein
MALETMQAATARLEAAGFVGVFHVRDEKLVCPVCNHLHDPENVMIHEIVRFEGASDPDDEAAIFALECPVCDVRGTWTVAYGPSMSADEAAVAPRLRDVRSK